MADPGFDNQGVTFSTVGRGAAGILSLISSVDGWSKSYLFGACFGDIHYIFSRRFVRQSVCPSIRPHSVQAITLKQQEVSTRNIVGK